MAFNIKTIEEKSLFPIIPISEDKKPVVAWNNKHNHIYNINELSKYPNIGAYATITGEISGVMVVDIDKKGNVNGHESFKNIIDELQLTPDKLKTLVVKTPNDGLHLYFKYKKDLRTVSNILPGIDIRTDGGIIISPGSYVKRRDGKVGLYQVVKDYDIAEIPGALYDYLKEKIHNNSNVTKEASQKEKRSTAKKSEFYKEVTEGGRDETLYKYCCRLVNAIRNEDELLAIADMYNQIYFKPPLTNKEVREKVYSAMKHLQKPYINKDGRVDTGGLVLFYAANNVLFTKGSRLYRYNEKTGVYDVLTPEDLQKYYYNIAEENGKMEDISEAKASKFTKTILQYAENVKETEHEKRFIACKNGIIDSIENKLLPFDSKYKLDCRFNGSYNPNYDEWLEAYEKSKFKKFLKEILNDDDVIWSLQEMWGNMLCPHSENIQQIFLYYGVGSNGKSSLFDIQEALFENKDQNICALGLNQFSGRFTLSMLQGKRVNIQRDDEMAENVSGAFRSTICGEYITTEEKNMPHKLQKFNLAWFYGVNKLPNTKDKSNGFYRRNCIIPFNNIFGTKEEVAKGEADRVKVPGIVSSIIEEELDIIFMWAYWGLQRLIKQKWTITPNKASIKIGKEYKEDTNSVYAYYNDKLIKIPTSKIKATTLYENYQTWCEKEHRDPVKVVEFGRQMAAFGHKKYKSNGIMIFPDVDYKTRVENGGKLIVFEEIKQDEIF